VSVLADLRREYHRRLFEELVALRGDPGVPSMADKDSRASVLLARGMCERVGQPMADAAPAGQRLGSRFGELTCDFLRDAFKRLGHLRPGPWVHSTSQGAEGIMIYEQYAHLAELNRVMNENAEMKAVLGGDYYITPDIVIAREPADDPTINRHEKLLDGDDSVGRRTPLRASNLGSRHLLHASVSCKWSIRSDRSQNSRTEALNLIRNRKGNTPHIVVVTFEPLPARIASIALGTGDIDCTYHVALDELADATHDSPYEDAAIALDDMIRGRRLRDISDLPLDLAI